MHHSHLTPAMQLSIRSALAAGLAVAAADLLHFHYPLYALIGAIIVSDLSPSRTRRLALVRMAGSALGATIGAATCWFLPPNPWSIGFSVLIAMFLGHLIHLQGAAKVTGYVCGIVVLGHSGDPWSYGLYRLTETLLGIGLAILVSLVPKLIPIDESKLQDA